jgi:uncharacterized protein YjbI with pentapeptide repeats
VVDAQDVVRLKESVQAWNDWRLGVAGQYIDLGSADLTGANLVGANLSRANLIDANLAGANLTGANLAGAILLSANMTDARVNGADLARANLSRASLIDANLAAANLTGADLAGANLTNAVLVRANFTRANLTRADLTGADLSSLTLTSAQMVASNLEQAHLLGTVLANLDLSETVGLDRCEHRGPSIIDLRTLMRSRNLPISFLRGCGLPDVVIDHLPTLTQANPIQFYSVFISYSTANQDFAERLHADLQANGVRCWFAPHDIVPGQKIYEQIDAAIRVYDKLLLVLSKESMASTWVKTEIAKARKKERDQQRHVLFPLRLVPFEDLRAWDQFDADLGDDSAKEIREYYLPDFSDWKNEDTYTREFQRMLNALTSDVKSRP